MITIISEHLTHISDIKIYHRIFFHPDCTVGFGITPNHALRLVGFTTGRELHPALKNYSFYSPKYSTFVRDVKPVFSRTFLSFQNLNET